MRIAVGVLLATQLLNLAFVPWLGPAGLALAIGLGALGNAAFLLHGLLRSGVYRPQPGWWPFVARVVVACVVLGVLLVAADRLVDWIALGRHWAQRAGLMAAVLVTASGLYLGTLRLMGVRLGAFMRRG